MRSINSCQIPVKRKTLNVVDVFVPRLFVVVTFHTHSSIFGSVFIHLAEYTKASNPWLTGPFFQACAKLFCPCASFSRPLALRTRKLLPPLPPTLPHPPLLSPPHPI